MRLEMRKIKLRLNYMKLNLKNFAFCGVLLGAALGLSACGEKQPDFKFIHFHAPPASVKTAAAKKRADVTARAEYKKRLIANGFSISHVGKWIQLDCSRALLFKTESANYRAHTDYMLSLVRAYMSTFSIEGLTVSVYGAPPKPAAFEQALTNECAINIANSINERQNNLPSAAAVGYGVNDPIALNTTAHGRNTNKRISIRFELEQSDLQLI